MSFITPNQNPVSVYRWDDTDAPTLSRTPDSVSTLFKACLVTGYGSKQSAGWSMPFEDASAGVKVFNTAANPDAEYYLRFSEDNGKQVTSQVYLSMTDIDNGDFKLQCDTQFKYLTNAPTGRWTLIASKNGVWFFCEYSNNNGIPTVQSGSYFYCGPVKNNRGHTSIYLKHTGGTWGDTDNDRFDIFSSTRGGATSGKLFSIAENLAISVNPTSFFNGSEIVSKDALAFPLVVFAFDDLWQMPAYAPSRNDRENYNVIVSDRELINHATASTTSISNLYVPVDFWEV